MSDRPDPPTRPPWQRVRHLLQTLPHDYESQRAAQVAMNQHEFRLAAIGRRRLSPTELLAAVRQSQTRLLLRLCAIHAHATR